MSFTRVIETASRIPRDKSHPWTGSQFRHVPLQHNFSAPFLFSFALQTPLLKHISFSLPIPRRPLHKTRLSAPRNAQSETLYSALTMVNPESGTGAGG